MGKFYQCLQSYGPSFMTKFCSALYLENLLTNIFAKLNLRGGVSCMPAALLLSLASLLWDIGKQYSPRCDAAERGVPSGAILFAYRNFIEKWNKILKSHLRPLKKKVDTSN